MKSLKQSCLILAALFAGSAAALQAAAPTIIFISDNTQARDAIQEIVVAEYNAQLIENLRVTDFAAWEAAKVNNFEDIKAADYRSIPRGQWTARDARYNAIKAALGLQDTDPADKGFTDLLEAAGYNVRRSITIRDEDPITGAVSLDHEFYGDIGEPYSVDGDYKLSQAQIDDLSQADLIIFSNDIDTRGYSKGGREAGVASTVLIQQWNSLPVPMIVMNTLLMATNPFGDWGFGWSYGYSISRNLIQAYDRQAIQTGDRFVFPDLRPSVTTSDPVLLAGTSPVDDSRLAIYDTGLFPILPQSHRKFSNNPNYAYPDSATVVLEFTYPSFVNATYGDIPTRDPVMVEFEKDVLAFTEEIGGNPAQPPLPTPLRIAFPAETRLYFAAGVGATGLYNLSEAGAQVFLNAVAKYAGSPSGGGGPLTPDQWNTTTIGQVWGVSDAWGWSAFMGFVHFGAEPWIYQHPFGYLYPLGSFALPETGTGYWLYSQDYGWIYASDQNEGLFQHSSVDWDWNNFLTPRS